MAWKRLTVDDLRLTLAEDEIDKLSTRSLDTDIQNVLQDQLDMAADAFRGAWLSKGYEVDVRAHYVAPEYRQFVLDYARYQIWTRFPMAEDYALSKPREESWKTAVEMLKNPYLATSKPDYSDDPAAEEEAKKRSDSSISMPWLRMPGEVGEYGFPVGRGNSGSCAKDVDPNPTNWMRYLSAWTEQPKIGSVCKTDTHWKIFTVNGWENLADLSVDWSDISAGIDWNQLSNNLQLSTYAKQDYVDNKFQNYLPLSGGILSGSLKIGNEYGLQNFEVIPETESQQPIVKFSGVAGIANEIHTIDARLDDNQTYDFVIDVNGFGPSTDTRRINYPAHSGILATLDDMQSGYLPLSGGTLCGDFAISLNEAHAPIFKIENAYDEHGAERPRIYFGDGVAITGLSVVFNSRDELELDIKHPLTYPETLKFTFPYEDGVLATEKYVDDIVGDINSILEALN